MIDACACGATLGRRNKTGRCRACSTRFHLCTPENRVKVAAGLRRHYADPAVRAAQGARSQQHLRDWRQREPEKARELGLSHIKAAQEALRDPVVEAQRRQKIRRTMLPGIPEHRWDEYARLVAKIPTAEARRVIAEDEAAIERRRVAALTPLDRQLERVRNGAAVVPALDLRRTGPAMTLGGVATAML